MSSQSREDDSRQLFAGADVGVQTWRINQICINRRKNAKSNVTRKSKTYEDLSQVELLYFEMMCREFWKMF